MHSKSVQVCIPGCTCPCHHEKILTFNRPSMNDLIDLLKNRDWKAIQEALQLDRTIAMRMEDSPEEDAWFHDVKKLYALRKWRNYKRSKIENQDDHRWKDVTKTEESILGNGKNGANSDEQRSNPQHGVLPPGDSTQLRYWVNSHGQQKRTLLHIICRHYLLPDEGLLAELKAGETEGLMDVMQAARTAEMLVRASHNLSVDWNEVKDDETKCNNQSETMGGECDEHCMDCPCLFYHHYCPPVKQPPVECIAGIESKKRQSIWQNLISGKDLTSTEGVQDDFVLHESVLTMTDAMGETPLHALTGAGSCNVELVKAIVKSCRPLESICLEMCHDGKDNLKAVDNNTVSLEWCNSSAPLAKNDDLNSFRLIDNQIASSRGGAFEIDHDRRPTVHDLLSCRSGHGCTPLHFVADKCFEEVLVLLLEQCPPSSPYYTKPNSSTTYEPLHPTMMADNDGDLPLHFAASNGASSNILHILTISMGDARSALVRNSQGRLAIDDTYVWYTETLDIFDESDENDTTDNENSTVFEVDERNNDDADLGASSDHEHVSHECVPGDQRNNNIERLDKDSVQSMQEKIHFCLAHGTVNPLEILREKFSHLFNQDAEKITHWRNELWGRMLVLIEAAAKALVPSSSLNPFGPVHAAVLATKYGNFPPIALVASLLADHQPSTSTGHLSHHIHERKCFRRMRELCSMKSRDYLPLHLACCDKFFSSNDLRQSNKRILEATQKLAYPRNPSESNSMSLDRWNTADFPFSMVYFLLYLWPFAAKIPTKNGRVPLHLALECNRADDFTVLPVYGNVLFGYTMEPSDIMALLKACPEALHAPDITTHLYPFQTASASTSTMACNLSSEEAAFNAGNDVCSINELERATRLLSLENTYRLIMEDPSLCRKIGRIGGGL